MCPRVCPRSPPYTGGTQLFLLNNGHLRRLSDTFHWFFSRRAASRSRLQLFQPLIQESQFGRVLDGPALEVPPDDQAGGSSSSMSSRMKISICFAQRGTLSATA